MSLESGGIPSEIAEQKKESPLCIYIAGAGGTNKGQGGIDASLKSIYGAENVRTYNSAFSPDKPNREKYINISETVETTIAADRTVALVMHSMGATEGLRVIKKIQKKDPAYFDDPDKANNLNLKIIAAPGFFGGLLGPLKTLKAIGGLGKESAGAETVLHAVDGVNAFPPEGISQEALHEGIRSAFGDKSLYDESVSAVSAESYTDYTDQLEPQERDVVSGIDSQLREALQKQDADKIREILLQRGKVVLPQINKIYSGDYFDQSENSAQDTLDGKWTVGAFLGLTSLMSDMFRGVPKRKFRQLEKKGVNVEFIIPEYDMMMPLSTVLDFFEGDEDKMKKNTTIMRGHAHSTLALQSNPLAQAFNRK